MADAQDKAESLDDDEMAGEFPPDHLMGAEAYGAAGADPGAPEDVARRAAREEPEERPLPPMATTSDPTVAVLSDEDDFAGDETLRDVVQEREAPQPAEEAAIHAVDEPAFDSTVDDPELAAANEIDLEPER